MKFEKWGQIQFVIVTNFINCLAILIGVFFYINKIKINYIVIIFMASFIIIMNILSMLKSRKTKSYIEELEDKVEMYEAIIEASPNAVFVHKKLNFIYTNTKGAEFLDLKKPSELIGKHLERFIKLNKPVIGSERFQCVLEEKDFEPLVEEIFYRENGEIVEIEIFSTPIKIKGAVSVLVLCKNVTEKKRILELEKKLEQEEKKLREKIEYDKLREEFFANLSHEFRTPIAIILGSVQLIENNSKMQGIEQEKNFKMLKQNSYRLLRMVNNLLDITKIDSGYFNFNIGNYNIVSVVEDTVLSTVDYIRNKELYLEFDTNIEEKIISCDRNCIERIILNLLSNSIKFTPKGGSIYVNVFDEGENVKIVVTDTGIGIKDENIDLVFDRFRQVDKSFTRNHEGSGMGLSLVKSLVEMQGGKISLNSKFNRGSEFVIEFPGQNLMNHEEINITGENEVLFREKINIEFSDIY